MLLPGPWRIDATIEGRRFRFRLPADTEAAAVTLAAQWDLAVWEGRHLEFLARCRRDRPVSYAEAVARFLRHVREVKRLKPRSAELLARTLGSLGHSGALGGVARGHIEEFVRRRNREAAASTVASDVTRLRRFFLWAVSEGLIPRDPTQGMERPRALRRTMDRHRTVTPAQVDALRLGGIQRSMVLGLLGSGLRLSELYRLRPSDVRDGSVHVRCEPGAETKGGTARDVPVDAACVVHLRAVASQALPGERAFRALLGRASKRAGISPPIIPHQLRHTAVSRWINVEGVSLSTAARRAGHASIRTTELYVHEVTSE